MSRKRYAPEQIINILREAEFLISQGLATCKVPAELIHTRKFANILPSKVAGDLRLLKVG